MITGPAGIRFVLDGQVRDISFNGQGWKPSTTVLDYLRSLEGHRGVKEGCGEGDCGACTIVVAELGPDEQLEYKAVNSCLLFLPMLHGKHVITIENLAVKEDQGLVLHPVQQALVNHHGTQCGYCTPGMLMSLFSLYKSAENYSDEDIRQALSGNLCRCTGYESIFQAAKTLLAARSSDHFTRQEAETRDRLLQIARERDARVLQSAGQVYLLPFTLDQALLFKQKYPGAIPLNGASDLAPAQNKKMLHYPALLDLGQLNELDFFHEDHGHWFIGSGLKLEALKNIARERIPSLFDLLSAFASRQIRQSATLAGNIATASPIGDCLPWLLVMEAKVHLQRLAGARVVPIDGFITAYRQNCLAPDELITLVSVPKPSDNEIIMFYKITARKDVDISTVSACFRLKLAQGMVQQVRIALGGMAAMTDRARATEAYLAGKAWQADTVAAAARLLADGYSPISDARAEAATRRIAAENLLIRFYHDTLQA